MSRPSDYNDATAAEICRRLSEGESLRKICRADDMPHRATVGRWLLRDDLASFRERYVFARSLWADDVAEETLEIADEASGDYIETPEGPKHNPEHVQRSRVRIETRKWIAGMIAPKKYGDRVKTEISGPDDGPIKAEVTVIRRIIVDPKHAPDGTVIPATPKPSNDDQAKNNGAGN